MKPVAAGTVRADSSWVNDDVLALRAASTVEVPPDVDRLVQALAGLMPGSRPERSSAPLEPALP